MAARAANEFYVTTDLPPAPPSILLAFPVGSINNPYSCPTAAQFDATMNRMPPRCVIHLGVATFETMGLFGWSPKTGQRIVGAGMGLTVLKYPTNAVIAGACMNDWLIGQQYPWTLTNIVIEDLTIDGNYQPGVVTSFNGIDLHGSGNVLRRVEVTGLASFTKSPTNYVESFGLIISSTPFSDASNNRIEDCYVHGYRCNYGNDLYSIALSGNNSGFILHNLITQDGQNWTFGIGPGSHQVIEEGNIMIGCTEGTHADGSIGWTNILSVDNIIAGACVGYDLANANFSDSMIANNEISLTNNGGVWWPVGAFRTNYPAPSAYSRLVITNNFVK
jgi:hypothetical protein